MNEIVKISGMECYEKDGTAFLKLETVARGLGFTESKDGNFNSHTPRGVRQACGEVLSDFSRRINNTIFPMSQAEFPFAVTVMKNYIDAIENRMDDDDKHMEKSLEIFSYKKIEMVVPDGEDE